MWASENGRGPIVQQLLSKGANVNLQDKVMRRVCTCGRVCLSAVYGVYVLCVVYTCIVVCCERCCDMVCVCGCLLHVGQYRCMDATGDVDLCMLVMEICVVLTGDGVYHTGCC